MFSLYDTAGIAAGRGAVRNVAHHHRAGAYGASCAYSYAGDDGGAGAYEGAFAHMHVAAQRSVRRYMHEVAYDTFVVDGCAGVDDAVAAYASVGLDDGSVHHHAALAYACRGRYCGRGGYNGGIRHIAASGHHAARTVGAYADEERTGHGGVIGAPHYRVAVQVGAMRCVVVEATDADTGRLRGFHHHEGVAAGTI